MRVKKKKRGTSERNIEAELTPNKSEEIEKKNQGERTGEELDDGAERGKAKTKKKKNGSFIRKEILEKLTEGRDEGMEKDATDGKDQIKERKNKYEISVLQGENKREEDSTEHDRPKEKRKRSNSWKFVFSRGEAIKDKKSREMKEDIVKKSGGDSEDKDMDKLCMDKDKKSRKQKLPELITEKSQLMEYASLPAPGIVSSSISIPDLSSAYPSSASPDLLHAPAQEEINQHVGLSSSTSGIREVGPSLERSYSAYLLKKMKKKKKKRKMRKKRLRKSRKSADEGKEGEEEKEQKEEQFEVEDDGEGEEEDATFYEYLRNGFESYHLNYNLNEIDGIDQRRNLYQVSTDQRD